MLNEFLEKNDAPSSSNENYDSLFELVADEDRKKYVCKSAGCGKFFRYKSEIIRHTATHSESRPFICQYENCQKAFKRNDALENHIRSSHTKETPFTCPVQECGLKFTTHGSFRYHVLKHNKQLSEEEILAASKEEDLFDMPQATKQIKIGEMADNVSTLGCQPPSRDAAYQKFDKNNYEEFFTPPPKFAGKIKWEMVSEETECTSPCQKKEDTPHDNYTAVLEENKILKDKLSTSQKVIQTMQTQINDLLNNLFVCQSQLGNLSNPIHLTGYNQQEPFQRPGGFPMQNNFPVQSNFPVNMLNYGKNMPGKPAETQFNTESTISSNSVDRFLSFGKESNSFNF